MRLSYEKAIVCGVCEICNAKDGERCKNVTDLVAPDGVIWRNFELPDHSPEQPWGHLARIAAAGYVP